MSKDKKCKSKKREGKKRKSDRVFVHGSISEPVYRISSRSSPEKYIRADGQLATKDEAKTFETWHEANDHRKTFVHRGLFIVESEHRFATYCPDCIPPDVLKNLGEDWVDTWEVGSNGWTDVPVCEVCHVSLCVYVDGKEGDSNGDD